MLLTIDDLYYCYDVAIAIAVVVIVLVMMMLKIYNKISIYENRKSCGLFLREMFNKLLITKMKLRPMNL